MHLKCINLIARIIAARKHKLWMPRENLSCEFGYLSVHLQRLAKIKICFAKSGQQRR